MFLGIDIGSSYIKSAFLSIDEKKLCAIKRVESLKFTHSKDFRIKEYLPEKVFEAVKSEIDIRIEEGYKIDGVMISTQMHGFVLVSEDGFPISNYVSWQDERALDGLSSGESYQEAVNKILSDKLRKVTGATNKLNLSIYSLYHFINNNEVKKGTLFMMMGDYIAFRLTNQKSKSHITNAASTGIMDIGKGTWNKEIIRKLGFSILEFPEITENLEVLGEYRGIKIYPAVGDQQASLLGWGTLQDTDVYINISTGSQIFMITSDLTFGDFETRPFFNGKFLLTNADLPSGRSLEVLVEFILNVGKSIFDSQVDASTVWKKINDISEKRFYEGNIPEVNLSFHSLVGEKKGYIKNITQENFSIENIIVGAITSLISQIYEAGKEVIGDRLVERVVLSGGVAQNIKIISELIETKFALPCELSKEKEEALHGLLTLATELKES